MVVGAATVQEVGAAFAVGLFSALGAAGATFARFAVAGIILCVAIRPRLRGLSRRAWLAAAGLGCSLAAMNLCFYQAISRIPLGIAVTVEALGPLVLSVALSRRPSAVLWAVVAFTGIAILGVTPERAGHLNGVGVAFAAGAGLSWATYIIASTRAAQIFPKLEALAIATVIGVIPLAPFAFTSIDGGALRWHVAALALAVALMSSVIPYSLEMWSMRTLAPATFAVVTCLSPVIAAIAGWVVLGQRLTLLAGVAIVLVTSASIGTVRSARRADRLPPV
jgi:inner membrane transporter RhtA